MSVLLWGDPGKLMPRSPHEQTHCICRCAVRLGARDLISQSTLSDTNGTE